MNPGPTTRASLGLPSLRETARQRNPGTQYDYETTSYVNRRGEPVSQRKTPGYDERMQALQDYLSEESAVREITPAPYPTASGTEEVKKPSSIWVDQWPSSALSPGGITDQANAPGGMDMDSSALWEWWFANNPGEPFPGWASAAAAMSAANTPGPAPQDSPTSSSIGGAVLAGLGIILALSFFK